MAALPTELAVDPLGCKRNLLVGIVPVIGKPLEACRWSIGRSISAE
jgi:hypothetical protein